jgi:hypothetical protein
MFGSTTLDVVVGLIFIYLLASLIVTAATELIAGWLSWRADKLWDGIRNLINSPEAEDWARKLYDHPLIQGLTPLPTKAFAIGNLKLAPEPKGPSYIPSHTFSSALIDLIQKAEPAIGDVANQLQKLLDTASSSNVSASDIKKAVLLVVNIIPTSSPPSLSDRLKTDLQGLADKIPDSDLSLDQMKEGIQLTINKISGADWTQVTLKKDLQNLINNPGPSGDSLLRLRKDLQAVIDAIPDSPVTAQIVKKDLQTVLSRVPDWVDPAAVATQIVRAFANNIWERYSADIINEIPNANLRTILSTLLKQSEYDIQKFKEAIETWFNDAMDRVSGWYKRHTQWVHLLLGIGFTFALNLDSVLIVRILSKDNSGLRESLVAAAQKFAEHPAVPINAAGSAQPSPSPAPAPVQQPANAAVVGVNPEDSYRLLQAQFDALNLPIGWTPSPPAGNKKETAKPVPAGAEQPNGQNRLAENPVQKIFGTENPDFRQWPGWTWQGEKFLQWLPKWLDTIGYHFIGWVLTAIAVSLGAPFWFDLLSRFVAIRATGDLPEEQTKPSKKDASTQKI